MKTLRNLNHVELIATLFLQKDYIVNGVTLNIAKEGYTFKFDKASRRFGRASYRNKTISLSRPICEANLNNAGEIINTILHEVAHILEYLRHRTTGHGYAWQSIARSIGCDGERYYNSSTVIQPESKYSLVCPGCSKKVAIFRKPKRSRSCGICCPGRYNEKFKMKLVQNY